MAIGSVNEGENSDHSEGAVTYVEKDGKTYALLLKDEYERLTETAHLLSNQANADDLREGLEFFERNTPAAKPVSDDETPAYLRQTPSSKAYYAAFAEAGFPLSVHKTSTMLTDLCQIPGGIYRNMLTGEPMASPLGVPPPRSFSGTVDKEIKHTKIHIKRIEGRFESSISKVSPARPEHAPKVGALRKRPKSTTD